MKKGFLVYMISLLLSLLLCTAVPVSAENAIEKQLKAPAGASDTMEESEADHENNSQKDKKLTVSDPETDKQAAAVTPENKQSSGSLMNLIMLFVGIACGLGLMYSYSVVKKKHEKDSVTEPLFRTVSELKRTAADLQKITQNLSRINAKNARPANPILIEDACGKLRNSLNVAKEEIDRLSTK
ncbi:MAG: hypothetical protein K6F80_07155 [Oscillospiraceae bacterium]|nr:hypothetical protein [Oscillospiraceae bacterium]